MRGAPVVCFGDSLTEGWGVDLDEAFPAHLGRILKVAVVNAGWRGDRAADAMDRLEQQVLAERPRGVVVLFGGNEADHGDTLEEAVVGQRRILQRLRRERIPTLVVAHPYAPYGDAFVRALEALAREEGADFAADALAAVHREPGLLLDRDHPNPEGHRRLAEALAPAVERLLRRAPPR